MKRNIDRFLSLLLVCAMVLTMLPAVLAADGERLLLQEAFDGALNDAVWTQAGTAGAVADGAYQLYGGTDLRYNNKLETDYVIEFDLTLNECDGWAALRFAKPEMDSTHDTGAEMLYITPGGGYSLFKANVGGSISDFSPSEAVHVKVEFRMGKISVYFRGSDTAAVTVENAAGSGYVSFYANGSPTKCARIDNVTITLPADETTQEAVDAVAEALQAPVAAAGQTVLQMPAVPEGYTVTILSSSDPACIAADGTITPASVERQVTLTLLVTYTAKGLSAQTAEMTVTVPALQSGTVITELVNETFSGGELDSNVLNQTGTESTVTDGMFYLKSGTFLRGTQQVGANYTVEFDMTMRDCTEWIGVVFNGSRPHDYANHWDHGNSMLYIRPSGVYESINAGGISGKYDGFDPYKTYRVKLEVMDGKVRGYLDGKLLGEADFNGLENSYYSIYHCGYPATSLIDNVRVRVYERPIDLQSIADRITAVDEIVYGDKRLTYPVVPSTCSIEIESSSNEAVISKDGLLHGTDKAETVDLVFRITSTKTEGYALTKAVTVEVPVLAPAESAAMASFLDSKYGLFVHYVPRLTVNADGSRIMDGSGTEQERLNAFANAFDVGTFVQDAVDMQVDYVIITAWHANMVTLYPSEVMRKYGLENHQVSGRDLMGEIIDGLNEAGIDVYLYTHPRDGHDFPQEDAVKVGWTPQPGSANPDFNSFNYDLWNDFINDVYGELMDKYGSGIKGLFVDEGSADGDSWRVVDYQRLRETIHARSSNVVLMQNFYGTTYSMDVGMKEYFYWGEFDPNAGGTNGAQWPAYEIPVAVGMASSGWWAGQAKGQAVCSYNAEDMFRYTVLEAAVNVQGGGVSWAAGPYPNGEGWETGIKERLVQVGAYLKPIAESMQGTRPSTAFPTRSGSTVGNTIFAATRSKDGAYEYIHVLNAPETGSSLTIGVPADGTVYAAQAVSLNDGAVIAVAADPENGAVTLTLPEGMTWQNLTETEKLDYVIRLEAAGKKPVEETVSYMDDTDRVIRYGGSGWSYQRWYRHSAYAADWFTTTGGDYDGDIHMSGSEGAYVEVPFYGTGIAYQPAVSSSGTTACSIYVDGVLRQTDVSLRSNIYAAGQTVFEIKGLEEGSHVLKIVNTGSGILVSDAYQIYGAAEAGPVSLEVTTAPEVTTGAGKAEFIVSAKNARRLATATVTIELPENCLTDPVAEGLNGWYVIREIYEQGKLLVVMGCNEGLTGEGDILKLTLTLTNETGTAAVTITEALLAAYTEDAETFVEALLDHASAVTTVYNTYDVNRDGVVNLLDVTRAQRWYNTDHTICDVNGDGIVSIDDMILIMNHIKK